MKKIMITALALGAMTSVAFAEEPLKPTAGQPMQLSLAQLDDVTAAGWKHRKKFNVKIEIKQENVNVTEQKCFVCKNETYQSNVVAF